MSNSNSPEETIIASDVVIVEETSIPDFGSKDLPELVETMQQLGASENRLERSKEAEAIKSAFYKLLSKLKAEAQSAAEAAGAELESASAAANSKFSEIEESFKTLYSDYKHERAEYNRRLEEERAANLKAKQAVIDELKALVEAQEDVNSTFPRFREIQAKWKEIGPVPAANFRDINQTYQFSDGHYLIQSDGQKAVGVFNLDQDKKVEHNIINHIQCPDLHLILQEQLQSYNNRMINNKLTYEQATDSIHNQPNIGESEEEKPSR